MAVFCANGYERVKPPLVEFEESLLSGVGKAWALQTFRLLDPDSQRVMAVRADMTLQVARLAASRLVKAPRPLRLCYSGEVLRVGGEQLSPERQYRQFGCELIGSLAPGADAEIILLAATSLRRMGVIGLSIDLNLPTIVPAVFNAYGTPAQDQRRLGGALAHRDVATVSAAPGIGDIFAKLLAVAGPAEAAIERLSWIALPAAAETSRKRLIETVRLVREADPDLTLTVDPVERQGFEYQTGLSFTMFARGARGELGRGGRYRIAPGAGNPDRGADVQDRSAGEPAVGFSLFADAVLGATVPEPAPRRVFVPADAPRPVSEKLRALGWITVSGLAVDADPWVEARRLGCGHVLPAGADEPVAVE
jgi:ATP phosphoribosyltransferase regulatory subunit